MIAILVNDDFSRRFIVLANEPMRVSCIPDSPTFVYAGTRSKHDEPWHFVTLYDPDNDYNLSTIALTPREYQSLQHDMTRTEAMTWLKECGFNGTHAGEILGTIRTADKAALYMGDPKRYVVPFGTSNRKPKKPERRRK